MRRDVFVSEDKARETLLEEIRTLAFGRANDAVKLAFLKDEELERIDALDLSELSAVHRLANGTVELKMIDRIKLIELLLTARELENDGGDGGNGLLAALDRAAGRLGEGTAPQEKSE